MKQILALALLAPIAACATITRGTTEAFVVETEPSGATVTTSNGLTCAATPCTFADVKRNSEFTVTVELEGYHTTTHNGTHQTSGAGGAGMAGNVIVGGLIGVAVDASSGATQDLTPNPLRVIMRQVEPTVAQTVSMPVDAATAEAAAAAPADEDEAPAEEAAPAGQPTSP